MSGGTDGEPADIGRASALARVPHRVEGHFFRDIRDRYPAGMLQSADPPTRGLAVPSVGLTVVVIAFALAMAYLESAVVVYLRAALGAAPGEVFPLDLSSESSPLGLIEIGREAGTLVMIAAVGWLAGRSGLERLAWAAVVFGTWDIAYYAWLRVFSGWPPALDTWDLLFLIPVPWAGPVWSPVVVSLALVGFGLAMAGRSRRGPPARISALQLGGLVLGGIVVIVSFVTNADVVLGGGTPTEFAWPIFGVGMAIGIASAVSVLRGAPSAASSA